MRLTRLAAAALLAGACAPPPAPGGPGPASSAPVTPASAGPATPLSRAGVADSIGAAQVPAGYGTLRQEDVSINMQVGDVLVRLTPLDESVLRTLSPDSYRALRQPLEGRREQINRLAAMHGLRERVVWNATFFGLAPEAHFTPTDITITSAGREFRPLEVLPLTRGFSEHRLQPREQQSALLLFDDGLDVSQPITVSMGMERNTEWEDALQKIDRERALIRSRAARAKNP